MRIENPSANLRLKIIVLNPYVQYTYTSNGGYPRSHQKIAELIVGTVVVVKSEEQLVCNNCVVVDQLTEFCSGTPNSLFGYRVASDYTSICLFLSSLYLLYFPGSLSIYYIIIRNIVNMCRSRASGKDLIYIFWSYFFLILQELRTFVHLLLVQFDFRLLRYLPCPANPKKMSTQIYYNFQLPWTEYNNNNTAFYSHRPTLGFRVS